MAQPYVTGPCAVFCGVGSGGTPLFLGHAERTPSIQIRPSWSPVFCDFTGQKVPLDYMYDGEEAMVSLDTTRYNEAVYALLANRAGRSLAGSARGLDMPGEVGSLMALEGLTFNMWLLFPYATKPAMSNVANGPLPGGYHFNAAFLEGPDGLDGLGTTNRRTRLNFHCVRQLDFSKGNFYGTGALLLYDHDMTGLSGVTIN